MLPHQGNIYWQGPKSDSAGRPLVHSARKTLSLLKARMKSQRQNHGAVRLVLPDGSRMVAAIQNYGNVPLFRVYVNPANARKPSTVVQPSGLFEGRRSYSNMLLDGYFSDVQFVTGTGGSYQRTEFIETEELLGSLGYWASGYYPVSESDDRGAIPSLSKIISKNAWFPPLNSYAMEFTGEMRKVVQILNGMGQPHNFWSTATRAHGIWTGSDHSKWVIEISQDDGVTAWELPKTPLTDEDILLARGHMAYKPTPTSTTYSDMPPLSERIQLLAIGDMSEYYDREPFGPTLGFAFSEDGHEAINAVWRWNDDDNLEGKKSSLWSLTISGSESPSSATLTMEKEEWLYFPGSDAGCTLRYPNYVGTSGTAHSQFYYLPLNAAEEDLPTEFSNPAPVFAMFAGNERVVVYHKVDPGETGEFIDGRPEGGAVAGTYGGCYQYSGSVRLAAPFDTGSGSYQYGRYSKAFLHGFVCEGPAGWELPENGLARVSEWDTEPATYSYEYEQIGEYVSCDDLVVGLRGVASEHWKLSETVVERRNGIHGSRWTRLILPFHNRNAFYLSYNYLGDSSIDYYLTQSSWWTYAKGNVVEIYPWSSAYYVTAFGEENPCDCDNGATLPSIGYWTNDPAYNASWSLEDRYVSTNGGGFGGTPLQAPKADPNYPPRNVACWDQRGHTQQSNGCVWDEGGRGSCNGTRGESSINYIGTLQTGYIKLWYFDEWRQGELIYEETSDGLLGDSAGWVGPMYGLNPEDSTTKWMDSCVDVFTGAGSISVFIRAPENVTADTRYSFLGAHDYYHFDEMNLRSRGFFGTPFPELMR